MLVNSLNVELVAVRHSAEEMAPYERLLADAMRGEETLFVREDAVEAAWRIVDPILGNVTPVQEYAQDTWGPPEADQLIVDDGGWHNPAPDVPSEASSASGATSAQPAKVVS